MSRQKASPNENLQNPDGRRFYNRNAAKWPLEQDEILSKAIDELRQKARSKGERLSKNKVLHTLSTNKAFLKKIPAITGTHRLADSPKKTYARLAKRAQQPTVISPSIAKGLGLGQWNVNVAALSAEIENAMQKHSNTRLATSKDNH